MDKKLKDYAVRNTKNKRILDNNYRGNRGQQPPHKQQNTEGQNVARAYTAGNNEKNEDWTSGQGLQDSVMTVPAQELHGSESGSYLDVLSVVYKVITEGTCPKVKNPKTVGTKQEVPVRGKAYVLGGGDANPGSNTVTDLGSFDVYHRHELVAKNHAIDLSCDEKIRAPRSMEKGCQLFLAQVTVKENKDKSKEKRLEDVPTVRDFPKVFPEDLPGLPPI
ncbi:hypothetical protein Tco_0895136 [Tanacetum coccineum]|uniref:Uncharacterized protein n=1 Tax=Tanacetum coccineum TaxID=301880 RepID=A0ABQ5CK08_9ASTR